MAYTKIHAIKATINKAVEYICNPAKTDEKILIDSFATGPETAAFDFKATLSKTSSSDKNLAYHLIQSFMPGEVSYDEAHKIGQELADKLLENKYSYIVATHIDHDHIHNHIIFCAADNIEHKKYNDCKKSYYHIRNLSDKLCAEHNLSIINPGQKRGMKYNEWQANKNGTSWKAQLKKDIDESINIATNYENFIELMKARGYEIKGEEFGEGAAKYIAFRPLEGKQFVRGSDRSFGPGYTKETIKNRIEEHLKSQHKIPFPKKNEQIFEAKTADDLLKRKPKFPIKEPRTTLIDTTTEKMQNSPGLQKWASIQNLKAAAHAYAAADDIKAIEEQINAKKTVIDTSRSSLVSLEKKMKTAAEILHYAELYTTNYRYNKALHKAKDPDKYYREHDAQLRLFNSAEHVLKDVYKIDPGKMDIRYMKEAFELMKKKKESLSSTWKSADKELQTLQTQLKNLQTYIGDIPAQAKDKQTGKNKTIKPNNNHL